MTLIGMATQEWNGGTTWENAEQQMGGPLPIRRVFDSGMRPDWSHTGAAREGGPTCAYSIKTDDWVGIRDGEYDAPLSAILGGCPPQVRLKFAIDHEPEDFYKNKIPTASDPADWVAAQEHVSALVRDINADRAENKIAFGAVMMAYTAYKGDRAMWEPAEGTWRFLAVDGYAWDYEATARTAAQIFDGSVGWAAQLGCHFNVAEFGVANNHPRRARWIRDTVTYLNDVGANWGCYYNNSEWFLDKTIQYQALALDPTA